MLKVHTHAPTFVLIDGEALQVRVARLTIEEATAFRRAYNRIRNPESRRQVSTRLPGDEMEKVAVTRPRNDAEVAAAAVLDGLDAADVALSDRERQLVEVLRPLVPEESSDEVFVIPDAEIRRRRLAEMSPDARAAWHALDAEEDAAADSFSADAIGRYLTVLPGQLQEVGEHGVADVTAGPEVVRLFAGRPAVLRALVDTIHHDTVLSETQKNVLRSLFASTGSSDAPKTAAVGSEPGRTAADAEPKACATSVDAMASSVIG